MKHAIIFDFNRTLFDPEHSRLMPDARVVLAHVHGLGFRLFLVAQAASNRRTHITRLGIERYFLDIVLCEEKTVAQFLALARRHDLEPQNITVVGDRVQKEIQIGRACGMKTIWVRQGKFRHEKPASNAEEPDVIVSTLKEMVPLFT